MPMPQTTHIYHKGSAIDLCANCKSYSLIEGRPLCFALTDKQGRVRPHGVQPSNRCHCGKFRAAIGLPTRQLADELERLSKKK